jgi:hypothetical protein
VLRSASAKWGMNRLAFVAASIAALKVKKCCFKEWKLSAPFRLPHPSSPRADKKKSDLARSVSVECHRYSYQDWKLENYISGMSW